MTDVHIEALGNTDKAYKSAARIAALLESSLLDCNSIDKCNARINLDLDVSAKQIVLTGKFEGQTDGKEFSFDFNADRYIDDDGRKAFMFVWDPALTIIRFLASRISNGRGQSKVLNNWFLRTEFETARGSFKTVSRESSERRF